MRIRSKQSTSMLHKILTLTYWLVGVAAFVGVVGWVYRRNELT